MHENEISSDPVDPVAILLRKLTEAQARNARLSKRAFASRLGLSSGAFTEILQGKRALSHQIKLKIAPKLQLSPREEAAFFSEGLPAPLRPKQEEGLQLSTDQFHLISDWWHFAILNLIRTRGFKPHVNWIAKRLGLPSPVIEDAWERLFRLGFLVKGAGGKITRKHPSLSTTDGFFDLSIQKSHLEDLKMIERSLIEVPVDLRDHVSMTIALDKKDIPRAKEMIRVFRDQFESRIESESQGDEVYRLSVSLFPLTLVDKEQ